MILETAPLGFPWPTLDPFLFCVHHADAYPAGTEALGPDPQWLAGRPLGSDFEIRDGWRMYHGEVIPGFPRHPHRGFETVTVARSGLIDHADSLGATARFGAGDCQWMTAGRGIVHSEMFPLVHRDAPNPTELFQIWLNLPAQDKMVDPYFTMLWRGDIPEVSLQDDAGRHTKVTVTAGSIAGARAPSPPPNSWAARPESELGIWTLRMESGARCTLPPASSAAHRMLYFFDGQGLSVGGHDIAVGTGARVRPDVPLTLRNDGGPGPQSAQILVLQGRPIGEPVAHQGPFVMNTQTELQQAFEDYRRTRFGGWPWSEDGPAHAREQGRFAVHADGRREDAPEITATKP